MVEPSSDQMSEFKTHMRILGVTIPKDHNEKTAVLGNLLESVLRKLSGELLDESLRKQLWFYGKASCVGGLWVYL